MATISGYMVTAKHGGDVFRIKVKEGVRGMNIPVTAQFEDGKWRITCEGDTLTVLEVVKLVPEARGGL